MFKTLDLMLWLPVLSAMLGYILHSFSADGGASILDRFQIAWRCPVWALAALVPLLGLASGFVDNLVAGQDWQHALATGIGATLAAFFGAARQHASSSGAAVMLLAVALGFSTACSPALKKELLTIAGETAQCLVANADLPDEVAIEKCGVQEAEREIAKVLLGEQRKQASHAAHVAATIASDEAARKYAKQGCKQ